MVLLVSGAKPFPIINNLRTWNELFVIADNGSLLLDTSLLASEFAQVVELGAAHFASLVHFYAVNIGRFEREDTLHSHCAGHLPDGETFLFAVAIYLDYHSAIELDALLTALDDFVSDSDCVTRIELRVLLAGCKCFLSNFN